MEVAVAAQMAPSEIRSLTAADLAVLVDVLKRRHDG